MVEGVERFLPASATHAAAIDGLTPRERDVLEALAQGQSNQAIASQLGISEKTVRNRLTLIFDKLEVRNRAEALVLAKDHGLGRKGSSRDGR